MLPGRRSAASISSAVRITLKNCTCWIAPFQVRVESLRFPIQYPEATACRAPEPAATCVSVTSAKFTRTTGGVAATTLCEIATAFHAASVTGNVHVPIVVANPARTRRVLVVVLYRTTQNPVPIPSDAPSGVMKRVPAPPSPVVSGKIHPTTVSVAVSYPVAVVCSSLEVVPLKSQLI